MVKIHCMYIRNSQIIISSSKMLLGSDICQRYKDEAESGKFLAYTVAMQQVDLVTAAVCLLCHLLE